MPAELTDEIKSLISNPLGVAVDTLGMDFLYPWQAEVLMHLEEGTPEKSVQITLVTPNESGKTKVVDVAAALTHLILYPKGLVVMTSGDSKQLDGQIMPALREYQNRFPKWKFLDREIRTNTGGRLIAFTTDEPGRAEGWHPDDRIKGPLLIIVDEAKSVPNAIFESLDRCGFQAMILASSPGKKAGRFYETHYHLEGWKRVAATLQDCPHIRQDKIDRILANCGGNEKHPLYLSSVHGQFMDEDLDSLPIFSHAELEHLKYNPPPFQAGRLSAAIDFGEGLSETVVAFREGNKITIRDRFKEVDKLRTAARVIAVLKEAGLQGCDVCGDNGGPGFEVMNIMGQLGYEPHRQNGGSPPNNPSYTSQTSEKWHEAARGVRERRWIWPFDDPLIVGQLTSRLVTYTGRGLMGVEEKDDMKKRGLPSPDRADAVIMASTWRPMQHMLEESTKGYSPMDQWQQRSSQERGPLIPGACSGI